MIPPAGWPERVLKVRDHASKAAARRAFAIHAYVGANGGGKTLAMVHDTLETLRAGRPVLSTVQLTDWRAVRACPGGRACDDEVSHDGPLGPHRAAHPLYVPFRDYRQLLAFEGGDVLMDEVTGVASARESAGLPVQVVNFLVQLRRRDVLLRWTAPSWLRADKVIREVTQAVTDCAGYAAVTARRDDGTARLWRDRRLCRWETFDAFEFDEFSTHRRQTTRPLVRQWLWRPGSMAERAYDTLDPVLALGTATEAGMCMVCGGKRALPRCDCERRPVVGPRSVREVTG